MADEDEVQATTEQAEEVERSFTQEDVNRIVGREKAKFKDYAALKEKAQAYDELQEASKSELQKATERAAKAESELSAMKAAEQRRGWNASVSKESGVPERLLAHIEADSEEELRAIAEEIKEDLPARGVIVDTDGMAANIEPGGNAAAWLRSTLPTKYRR